MLEATDELLSAIEDELLSAIDDELDVVGALDELAGLEDELAGRLDELWPPPLLPKA